MKTSLTETCVFINPSIKLYQYISDLQYSKEMPVGISSITTKVSVDHKQRKEIPPVYYLNNEDKLFIKELETISDDDVQPLNCPVSDHLINLEDVHWIYKHLEKENALRSNSEKVYFHELFEGSKIVFPKNMEIPRSEELEKRCQKLRQQQQNQEYKRITKNVDNVRQKLPEDTISYQMKQLNKQLIAVFQFILSVAAGFAFGFIGIELIIGNLDFGFRLLLGIMCALIIALAELYFLAKKLNEDLQFDMLEKQKSLHPKID